VTSGSARIVHPVIDVPTYWTEDDYVDAVEQAGLAVITIDYPGPLDGQNPYSENPGG
jgi:hypothetical protein